MDILTRLFKEHGLTLENETHDVTMYFSPMSEGFIVEAIWADRVDYDGKDLTLALEAYESRHYE